MITPCRVWMSCRVALHAVEDVAQVDQHGVALVGGPEVFDPLELALEIVEEGEQLLARRRRRFLRHRERQHAAGLRA